MSTLITNIAELVTNAGDEPGFAAIENAALVIEDGRVAWTGQASRAPAADERVDAGGRAVLPGFVDSHAHLVFAGERGAEFAARMAGVPYSAGGIASTVAATRAASARLRASSATVSPYPDLHSSVVIPWASISAASRRRFARSTASEAARVAATVTRMPPAR